MTTHLENILLPQSVSRLDELAHNLWWSWHPSGRELFRTLDYPLWKMTGHNPVRMLRETDRAKLASAGTDPTFLAMYEFVMAEFDADMEGQEKWFPRLHPQGLPGPIAYFSAEFAIHNSLPIYAGGLGILAGDMCKEASDLGIPLVGVGLMYPQGYFRQRISTEGWQEEMYTQLDFEKSPVRPVLSPKGSRTVATVRLGERSVSIGAWLVRVGTTALYLLDTRVQENPLEDQQLSARLYIADREVRIQQEILLGVGGVRVLRALGIQPTIWHANEGHTAFMMLERVREEVAKGSGFEEAVDRVGCASVFTTHTPVPAGHDVFSADLVEKYLHCYWESLGIERERFMQMGRANGHCNGHFNMTALALNTADHCNAVSKLHGIVARQMWNAHWPDVREDQVPIVHVTNGIHVPTWIAPEMDRLFQKYLAPDWIERHDDRTMWEQVMDIPDHELWKVHQTLKGKLTSTLLEMAQIGWSKGEAEPIQVLGMGALLHPEILTLGYVRRFAEYKRPALIFRDIPRLKRLVNDPFRPLQIVFAGKSHPADIPSKCCLQWVYNVAADREFQGRIAFMGDHDMHMARYLVQGVDVWLNTPRRLKEACGTSGMKAALNGVPHLSIRDGWWYEGYNRANGWPIGNGTGSGNPEEEDRADAESLYRVLEEEILPLFYDRDRRGIPHGWIKVVKEAIRTLVPVFCARRMVKEYVGQLYLR